jgi:hypothetical protein
VNTAAEYRLYAEECRKLAAKTTRLQDKQALETIARAWDGVANEREAQPAQARPLGDFLTPISISYDVLSLA